MLIGIDGNEANESSRTGVAQYAYYLLWGLNKLTKGGGDNCHFIIYLRKPPRKDLPSASERWQYEVILGNNFWALKNLMPQLVKNKDLNVFFTPSHYLPPLPMNLPKICTIHDLGYLRFSEQFRKYDFWQLKLWTAISISISKYIIAVSNFTKHDIVRHYPSALKKIFVTYHGYDRARFNNKIPKNLVRRVLKKHHIPISKNYILFLSTLKPSKNIEGLMSAFDGVKKKHNNLSLVIAGKKGWLFDSIFEKIQELHLEDDVIFTDFVSEKDKPALLTGAKVFVSPSHWEGFGIHVLEAMATGTPVVVSRVASLPEVVGKAGVYVNPDDVESIASGIEKVLGLSQSRYNKLVTKTLEQAKRFSWEIAARKTLGVFERAAK